MHPLAATAALLAIAPLAVTAPVFGFASLSTVLAFVFYLRNNGEKLRAERNFFSLADPVGAAFIRIRSAALAGALVRSLAIGMLALFTFPPLEAADLARGGPLAAYGAQIDAERVPTLLVFYLATGLGWLVTEALARRMRAEASRWALYRLGLVYGLLFSGLLTVAHAQSGRILAAFPEPPPGPASLTLYEAPPTLAVLEAVRKLHADLAEAEQERRRMDRRAQECRRDFWFDLHNLREQLNRATWRCDEPGARIDPVPIARSALLTMAVVDDLIDGLVVDMADSVSTSLAPTGGTVPGLVRLLVSIVLSSNVLQGFVLAVHVAMLSDALRYRGDRRRRRMVSP